LKNDKVVSMELNGLVNNLSFFIKPKKFDLFVLKKFYAAYRNKAKSLTLRQDICMNNYLISRQYWKT
jgi:hypothetical protein